MSCGDTSDYGVSIPGLPAALSMHSLITQVHIMVVFCFNCQFVSYYYGSQEGEMLEEPVEELHQVRDDQRTDRGCRKPQFEGHPVF